jgi:hypothetical protein
LASAAGSVSSAGKTNVKYIGKPVPKQQVNDAAKDLKGTMSQIQSTINSLDTASDINTDSIQ